MMNEGHTMNVYRVELATYYNNHWCRSLWLEVNALSKDYAINHALDEARNLLDPGVDLSVKGCTYLYPVEG